jgi:glycosyltransferase involved in cell wall biosynthesis
MPEIIADGQTGYLVPVDDAEALANRALELLRNPALREQFGLDARQRVAERFTIERMLEQLENLFQREIAKKVTRNAEL